MLSSKKMRDINKSVLIIILGLSLWILGIILTPLLAASEIPALKKAASFTYFIYKPVCHQMPERSFLIDGFHFAVCIRCFAFYLGGLFISIIYLFKASAHIWKTTIYLLLGFPAVLDFLSEKFYLYSNIAGLRFITGLLFGLALFQLLLVSLRYDFKKENRDPEVSKAFIKSFALRRRNHG
jgi:uncharacterized membrane protein